MIKKILIALSTLSLLSLNSCTMKINASTYNVCGKLSQTSSVPIEKLLSSPESITVDNKEYNLFGELAITLDQQSKVEVFPRLWPEAINDCSDISFSVHYKMDEFKYLIKGYNPVKLWIIVDNKIWETSKMTPNDFGYYSNLGPAFQEYKDKKVSMVVKMIDNNGKEVFIKSKDNNIEVTERGIV